MHFVSEHTVRLLVQAHKNIYSQATGEKTGQKDTIWLVIPRYEAPDWAVDQAEKIIKFTTRPKPGELGGEDIPTSRWTAYIDTQVWAEQNGYGDEIRQAADRLLQANPDVFTVEPPEIEIPWPKYDDLQSNERLTAEAVAQQLIGTADSIGVDIQYLINYEETHQNRKEILRYFEGEILQRTGKKPEKESEVVSA